jgi:hypothetical protein
VSLSTIWFFCSSENTFSMTFTLSKGMVPILSIDRAVDVRDRTRSHVPWPRRRVRFWSFAVTARSVQA